MTKRDKLVQKFLSKPKDSKYSDLKALLSYFGYVEIKKGKTSGSRRAFISDKTKHVIRLHKPHQKDILKQYQIDYLVNELKKEGLL